MKKENYHFKIIKEEFLLFLMQHKDNIYPVVKAYIEINWAQDIDSFLDKHINHKNKPQNILNTAFNFYSTKEGYDYWNAISVQWKITLTRCERLKEVVKIKRKKIKMIK